MKNVAVILAGCGRMDGSEIHESVLTLLSIMQYGAKYQCFSLNRNQTQVINHLNNEVSSETRNMLVESARIARGDIKELNNINITDFDALIIPGGNGTAFNLFNLAEEGENYTVDPEIAKVCREFTQQQKPVGYICIAPAMIPAIYDFPVRLTIGSDQATADILTKRGAIHLKRSVNEICVDEKHKIVSTPAYMLATNILEAYQGINKLVGQVLALAF